MLRENFFRGTVVVLIACAAVAARAAEGVAIQQQPEKLVVTINGRPFTEYVIAGAPHA